MHAVTLESAPRRIEFPTPPTLCHPAASDRRPADLGGTFSLSMQLTTDKGPQLRTREQAADFHGPRPLSRLTDG
jgi:hypothetical protein